MTAVDSPGHRTPFTRALELGILALMAAAVSNSSCAEGKVVGKSDDDDSGATATSGGTGGGGACEIDCSSIETAPCQTSTCNEQTGHCEVVTVEDGLACDDGLFCTVHDTCLAGTCVGSGENDCDLPPHPCQLVTCDETTQQCLSSAGPDGGDCQDAQNLCWTGGTCSNGLCTGGVFNTCLDEPVPDECHVSVCDPMTGMCNPQPGNDGQVCTDANDLCSVLKTCAAGVCRGGFPKDCSALTAGCNLGVCDPTSGECVSQVVNEGDPCDDLNSCTVGEICGMGQCSGGAAVTQCVNADGCCPMGCTESNDDDCGCSINLAPSATASSNGGGSGGYGPSAWNDGQTESDCQTNGCTDCFGWISNTTIPNGAFMMYEWPAPVQIGSMYIDTNQCTQGACEGGARPLWGGAIQYWDGTSWVTAQAFSGNTSDYSVTFLPKLNTNRVRIYDAVAASGCGQASNSLVYEWHVWAGSNCMP